jgi:pimeloyl-ACP methyl ester carboxylesterase
VSARLGEALDVARLLGWLGPWAGTAAPRGVLTEMRALGGPRDLRCRVYAPEGRAPAGGYLVAQGLHHLGPDDPRMDRFCRVLAASGLLVFAPFLPDFLALRVAPGAEGDLALAWDALDAEAQRLALPKPAVFSISFGASPAIALAARPSIAGRVGALVLFGGFADFDASVRFAVGGAAEWRGRRLALARDPLNSPAVFLNLLPHLDVGCDRAAVADAWRAMVERTWGRVELKADGARDPIAHSIAAELGPAERELFLLGCGLRPGMLAALERGLERAGDALAFFDPRPRLPNVRAPVVVLHGRDDDVIPWFEAEKLRAALRPGHPHRLLVTGMAGHTGVGAPPLGELARGPPSTSPEDR